MPRLLLIDDDLRFGDVLRMVFYGHDIHLTQTQTDEAALQIVSNLRPDLIVAAIDVLGGDDEWHMLAQIRANPCLRQIPLLVISNGQPDLGKMSDMQISGYFRKPFSATSFRSHVLTLLQQQAHS